MTLKIAIIGAGSMGRNHARVLSEIPAVDLVGVADSDLNAAEAVTKRLGGRAYTDYPPLARCGKARCGDCCCTDHSSSGYRVVRHPNANWIFLLKNPLHST